MSGEPALTYRTIRLPADAALAARNHRDACVASFGDDSLCESDVRYLAWLKAKIEEFPDGFVLALDGDRVVGHLEMEVPYGLRVGYINLYYVLPRWRGRGIGRQMDQHAQRYLRAWEASRVELHVSPTNEAALSFYTQLGYRPLRLEGRHAPLWLMSRDLACAVPWSNSSIRSPAPRCGHSAGEDTGGTGPRIGPPSPFFMMSRLIGHRSCR